MSTAHILYLEIELYISYSHSLKSKRQVINRFKDRVSRQFNVSIAEVGFLDDWQRAGLAVAAVGSSRQMLESQVNALQLFAAEIVDAEIVGFHWQWL